MTPVDYDAVNPHENAALADALRARLDVPDGWVTGQDTGGGCFALGIAIEMHLEDTGDGESGPCLDAWPTRYALLTCDGPNAWILGFYDDVLGGDEGGDEGACVQLVGRMDTFEQVADAVAAVLTRATTLNAKPPILNTETERDIIREVADAIREMNEPESWARSGKPDERDYVLAACKALHIDGAAMEDTVERIANAIYEDAGETMATAWGIAAFAVKQLTLAYMGLPVIDNARSL